MKYFFIVSLSITLLFATGCDQFISNESMENNNDVNTELITYENEEGKNKGPTNFDGYEKSKQRRERLQDDSNQPITDQYTNAETNRIAEHLMTLDEINRAQVVSTDDRIVVGVILNLHDDQHIGNMIEEEVRELITDDRDIVVYTDEKYWYQRRNLDAKGRATQIGEDLEDILDNFFNLKD